MKSILGLLVISLFMISCNRSDKGNMPGMVLNSNSANQDKLSTDTLMVKDQAASKLKAVNATCPSFASFNDITANHTVPAWLKTIRFGIYIHYGLYSVAAYHNEWYGRYMYHNASIRAWHVAKYGATFGYKEFIPKFATNFNANTWANAFRNAGAGLVVLSAEHHDHFALWNSDVTKWCAGKMGAMHDVVGELAVASRARGMKFGCGNHRMYGYSWYWGTASDDKTVDIYDTKYADLYGDGAGGPPNNGCAIDLNGGMCLSNQPNPTFLTDWVNRNKEFIDKYQADMLWYDWDGQGSNNATKLAVASYYYTTACAQGKEVTLAGKGGVFPGNSSATGSNVMLLDYETGNRAPAKGSEPKCFWMVDDRITSGGTNWCYIDGTGYRASSSIISQIDDYKARGGLLLLNVAPMGDGTIPAQQITILNDIGKHFNITPTSVKE